MFVFGPLGGLVMPFPAKFRLRVLPPVHFEVATNQPRYNRSVVMEQSERIRLSVQDAVHELLQARKSVWFG
jgi:hypothetical protein